MLVNIKFDKIRSEKHSFTIVRRLFMEARSEVTIKFSSSLPTAKPTSNKKVEIELTDQNGIVFTALLNTNQYRSPLFRYCSQIVIDITLKRLD